MYRYSKINEIGGEIMRKCLFTALFFVSSVFADEVPKEVQKVIDDLMAGKTDRLYVLSPQNFEERVNAGIKVKTLFGFDSTTKHSEIIVGKPIRMYSVGNSNIPDSIGDESSNIKGFKPTDVWVVPLLQGDKFVCRFEVEKKMDGHWGVGTIGGSRGIQIIQKILEAYPESEGYHPIFVQDQGLSYYVPEIPGFSLTWVNPNQEIIPPKRQASKSNEELMKGTGSGNKKSEELKK